VAGAWCDMLRKVPTVGHIRGNHVTKHTKGDIIIKRCHEISEMPDSWNFP
jgi:hypothetical protein